MAVNLLLSPLFWGGAVFGFTALCSRRLRSRERKRSFSVPLTERIPPVLCSMLRNVADEPGRFLYSGLSVLLCTLSVCFVLTVCGERQTEEAPYDAVLMLNDDADARDLETAAAGQVESAVAAGRYFADVSLPDGGETGNLYVTDTLPQALSAEGMAVVSADTAARLQLRPGNLISVTLGNGTGFQIAVGDIAELGEGICLLMECADFEALTGEKSVKNAALIHLAQDAQRQTVVSALQAAALPSAVQPLMETERRGSFGAGVLAAVLLLGCLGFAAGTLLLATLPDEAQRGRRKILAGQSVSAKFWVRELALQSLPGSLTGVAGGMLLSGVGTELLTKNLLVGGKMPVYTQSFLPAAGAGLLVLAASVGGAMLGALITLRQAEPLTKPKIPDPKRGKKKEKRSEDQ